MDIFIKIKYDLKINTITVDSNVNQGGIKEIITDFLRLQIGKGEDLEKSNDVDMFDIEIGVDLKDDSFYSKDNTGNAGLRDGILMQLLSGKSTMIWEGGARVPEQPPHIVHGCPKNFHPTHTHGLASVGLPEMFINGKAYGVIDNTQLINEVVCYLYMYESEWENIAKGNFVEIKMWEQHICVRKVEESFEGVKSAYNDDRSETGYAQIYVKGDNHVLTDEFFIEARKEADNCDGGCDCSYPTIH